MLVRRRGRAEPGIVGDSRQQLAAAIHEAADERRVHHFVTDCDADRMIVDRQERWIGAGGKRPARLDQRSCEEQQLLERHVLAERHEVHLPVRSDGRAVGADQERGIVVLVWQAMPVLDAPLNLIADEQD